MGRSLSFFEDVSNYCLRCNDVVKNMVHQLAALFDERSRLFPMYRGVNLVPVQKALGSVLTVRHELSLIPVCAALMSSQRRGLMAPLFTAVTVAGCVWRRTAVPD